MQSENKKKRNQRTERVMRQEGNIAKNGEAAKSDPSMHGFIFDLILSKVAGRRDRRYEELNVMLQESVLT